MANDALGDANDLAGLGHAGGPGDPEGPTRGARQQLIDGLQLLAELSPQGDRAALQDEIAHLTVQGQAMRRATELTDQRAAAIDVALTLVRTGQKPTEFPEPAEVPPASQH